MEGIGETPGKAVGLSKSYRPLLSEGGTLFPSLCEFSLPGLSSLGLAVGEQECLDVMLVRGAGGEI